MCITEDRTFAHKQKFKLRKDADSLAKTLREKNPENKYYVSGVII